MVNIRTSTRSWSASPLDDDKARQLGTAADAMNSLSGLNFQLVRNRPSVFADANASGHFHNAADYLALIGPKGDDTAREKAGFYGERLVLTATSWALGTCWTSGSLDRDEAAKYCSIKNSEELYLVIAIGRRSDEADFLNAGYESLARRRDETHASLSFEEFTPTMGETERAACPDWFRAGVKSAMKAPSTMGGQPVRFAYSAEDDTASAWIDPDAKASTPIDLGIEKLNFQIGAGSGTWQWGEHGTFSHR